jgi:dienelactone hydrolase
MIWRRSNRRIRKFPRAAILFFSLGLAGAFVTPTRAAAPADSPPQAVEVKPGDFVLPSARPSGNPKIDRIWVHYYPPLGVTGKAPAIVMLHSLGDTNISVMRRFAHYLAFRGIGVAAMELPYHLHRRPKGERPGWRFVGAPVRAGAQAFRQAASDAETTAAWLQARPEIDPQKIGIVGISLGAILAHLAMGEDESFSAGVAFLGGGDLPDLREHSLVSKLDRVNRNLSSEDRAILRGVDPLAYATQNRPRHVLMVEGARDLLMPPRDARELWEALGRPPIEWMDANHFGLGLAIPQAMHAAAAYLRHVWSGSEEPFVPSRDAPIRPPTIKIGLIANLDSILTPAVQWQVFAPIHRPDHLSALHFDLGWSGRGIFAAAGVTLNPFIDAGIARRFQGSRFRPYASFHVVF